MPEGRDLSGRLTSTQLSGCGSFALVIGATVADRRSSRLRRDAYQEPTRREVNRALDAASAKGLLAGRQLVAHYVERR
jgi:hypothetical protein